MRLAPGQQFLLPPQHRATDAFRLREALEAQGVVIDRLAGDAEDFGGPVGANPPCRIHTEYDNLYVVNTYEWRSFQARL